jgi:hypothetical protein
MFVSLSKKRLSPLFRSFSSPLLWTLGQETEASIHTPPIVILLASQSTTNYVRISTTVGNHLRIQVPNSRFIMMSYQDLDDNELFLQSRSESAREILLSFIDGRIKLQCSFLDNYRGCLLETRTTANTGNYR